jgi:hypothetical protein
MYKFLSSLIYIYVRSIFGPDDAVISKPKHVARFGQ